MNEKITNTPDRKPREVRGELIERLGRLAAEFEYVDTLDTILKDGKHTSPRAERNRLSAIALREAATALATQDARVAELQKAAKLVCAGHDVLVSMNAIHGTFKLHMEKAVCELRAVITKTEAR